MALQKEFYECINCGSIFYIEYHLGSDVNELQYCQFCGVEAKDNLIKHPTKEWQPVNKKWIDKKWTKKELDAAKKQASKLYKQSDWGQRYID